MVTSFGPSWTTSGARMGRDPVILSSTTDWNMGQIGGIRGSWDIRYLRTHAPRVVLRYLSGDPVLDPCFGTPGLEKWNFYFTPFRNPDRLKLTHFGPFLGTTPGPSFCLVLSLPVVRPRHGFLAILHSPSPRPALNQPSRRPLIGPEMTPFGYPQWVKYGV